MNKIMTAAAIAALLTSSALPAFAQDAKAGVGVDAGAGVTVETPATDANAGAAVGVDANANANAGSAGDMSDDSYGSVMSSIKSNANLDLSTVTESSTITVVLLSSLKGNAETESAALDTALGADVDGQATLQSAIAGNAAIAAKLEAEGYAAEDVVSIKTKADGSVVLYVDDRA